MLNSFEWHKCIENLTAVCFNARMTFHFADFVLCDVRKQTIRKYKLLIYFGAQTH